MEHRVSLHWQPVIPSTGLSRDKSHRHRSCEIAGHGNDPALAHRAKDWSHNSFGSCNIFVARGRKRTVPWAPLLGTYHIHTFFFGSLLFHSLSCNLLQAQLIAHDLMCHLLRAVQTGDTYRTRLAPDPCDLEV